MALPLVLLHDHLDGGLRPATIIELAADQGVELPAPTAEGLAGFFDQSSSGSLVTYLDSFRHTVSVMQTGPALERVAYEAVVDLAADGVVYAELRFAPHLHTQAGLSPDRVVRAVTAGLQEATAATATAANLILCALRTEDHAEEVVRLAEAHRNLGVVGVDLAGPEKGYPADRFAAPLRRARESGVGVTIHAGESDGARSIAVAWAACGAERIGHGVAIAEDCRLQDGEVVEFGSLAARVRDRRLPLEICPTSNLHTKGWRPEQHPAAALHRAGFNVTINTDNRLMSRTSATAEFELLRRHHGFTDHDVAVVTRRALKAAFWPWPAKRRLWEEVIAPRYRQAGVEVSPWE